MKDRIKFLRKDLGLTQEKFAEKLHMKRNTIANYEIGRNEPIDAVISLICREFNVNEDWLRNGKEPIYIELDKENQLMMWAANILKDESDSFKKRFVKMLMELDESDWETLEKFCMILYKESHDVTPGSETSPKT